MGNGVTAALTGGIVDRVRRTAALLEERGYATTPGRLGRVCIGGELSEHEVRAAIAAAHDLREIHGLVVPASSESKVVAIVTRAERHAQDSLPYLYATRRFVEVLLAVCPQILCVAVAGSLASGGFVESDDIDLNLFVEDGTRHQVYVALNLVGFAHALRHRDKPVDQHSLRPLAPRLMTANLILERGECFPLERRDEAMAYELLISEPLFGAAFYHGVVSANPALLEHFPQLTERPLPLEVRPRRRLPRWASPRWLEPPSRHLARAGWRYMQWTRRKRPEALARVAFVRQTMRPYVLFPDL